MFSSENNTANWLLSLLEDVLEKPMAEHRFTKAPTTFLIKLFLERFAQSRTGLLEERITDMWNLFRSSYRTQTVALDANRLASTQP